MAPDRARPTRTISTGCTDAVRLGDLADLLLLDVRSYRDEPVPGHALHDEHRSMLGAAQAAWLRDELGASRARWRIVGVTEPDGFDVASRAARVAAPSDARPQVDARRR